MSHKWSIVLSVLGGLLLAIGLTLWVSTPTRAQCGDYPPKSSCITCHTVEDPVYDNGEWHCIHARKDSCIDCHGGNGSTMDKDLAHESLEVNPLNDTYTDCHHCHPDDYQARATYFGAILGVLPGSSPTPTAVPVGPAVERAIVILPPPISNTPSFFPWHLALGGLVFTALFLLGLRALYTHLYSKMSI